MSRPLHVHARGGQDPRDQAGIQKKKLFQFTNGLGPAALLLRVYLEGGGNTELPPVVVADSKLIVTNCVNVWRIGLVKIVSRYSISSNSISRMSVLFVTTPETSLEENLSSNPKSEI